MPSTPHVGPTERPRTRMTYARVRAGLLWLAPLLALSSLIGAQDSQRRFALESAAGLRLQNVTAVPATLQGKKGIRVTMSEDAQRQLANPSAMSGGTVEQLAMIEGLEFDNGVIEAEIAGAPMVGAPAGARGFVGLAFRLQNDMRTYDAFYLRPTNGRADDQVRRNHSAQYISHPDWPWSRLRKETPEKDESYVDLVPGEWAKVRIEVRGAQAKLYVHDQPQPTLVVNDLKSGETAKARCRAVARHQVQRRTSAISPSRVGHRDSRDSVRSGRPLQEHLGTSA